MKDVESAGRALEAYTGRELAGANPEQVQEDLQDLLTDLEHFAEVFGCSWPEYQAHLHYLQESQRCFGCGMTREEIQTEYQAELGTNDDHFRLMPPEECAGWWDKLGEAGPHVWEEVVARTREPRNVGEQS